MLRKSASRVKTRSRRKYNIRKKKFLFWPASTSPASHAEARRGWHRGNITLYILLIIIIIGAYFLVGGTSNFTNSPVDKTPAGEVIKETPGIERESLQLQTIRFKKCSNIAAVDFLIDTSGSMRFGTKLADLKNALSSFTKSFGDKSVTGIRRFSSLDNACYPSTTSRLVPIDFYSSNKSEFSSQVANLCADGATSTRTAFEAEKNDLEKATADPKFKDKTFNLIFVTDGIPESRGSDHQGACTGEETYPVCATNFDGNCRCFDSNQDPTTNPQIAEQIREIKSLNGKNIRIFSVLVFDDENDGPFKDQADKMMSAIATSAEDYYKTTDPKVLTKIYNQIAEKICTETGK